MRLLSVGFACNNACTFCAQGELRAREPTREPALSSIVAGEAVAFVGGEPTLRDELPAWVAEADRLGAARVLVQTNARRLSDRAFTAALARASRKLSLEVSLQGGSAPVHDWHTGAPGSFAETVRGLAAARAAGIPFHVTSVVTRSSFRNLVELVRVVHGLRARALWLSLARPFGRALAARDRVVPAPELALPYVSLALAEARRLGLRASILPLSGTQDTGGPSELVGLGETEPRPASAESPEPPRVALQMYGRPSKARAEVRVPVKKSGDHLRELFPGLFGDTGEGGS